MGRTGSSAASSSGRGLGSMGLAASLDMSTTVSIRGTGTLAHFLNAESGPLTISTQMKRMTVTVSSAIRDTILRENVPEGSSTRMEVTADGFNSPEA